VAKLRTARERKRKTAGKCEGRKSWAEINPELVRQAKRLRRRSPKGHQRSLRDIARELEGLGYVNQRGKRFSAASVQSMLSLMKNGPSAEFAGRKDPCFIRGTVKQVAIGGGNCETLSRDHWNQRCILGSLCRHLHGVHGPAAGTGAICGATQRPGRFHGYVGARPHWCTWSAAKVCTAWRARGGKFICPPGNTCP
jgi:hypothetical protein